MFLWRSCWHDVVTTLYLISIQFPDNAKPMSRRMRSRCQRECEADVKEKVIWTDFGMILDSCLNDFGGHDGMTLLVLSMSFWNRFQMMRSLCQDECEADVKILRSRCQSEFGSSAELR